MSRTHDCGGDVAAYLLGALEPAEAEAFREHLEDCVVCRDELESLRGVVQALPMAAPQHPAPRSLRRRVLHTIRKEPRHAPAGRRRGFSRPAGRPRRLALGSLAAAVIAACVVAGLELAGGGGGTRLIQAHVSGISGSAELRVLDGRGELIVHRLSPPPPAHVYEVWLKPPHSPPRPASVLFTVTGAGGADVGLPGSLRGISQVMVTPEPDGGSPAPTHTPVIVAQLA